MYGPKFGVQQCQISVRPTWTLHAEMYSNGYLIIVGTERKAKLQHMGPCGMRFFGLHCLLHAQYLLRLILRLLQQEDGSCVSTLMTEGQAARLVASYARTSHPPFRVPRQHRLSQRLLL